MANNKILRNDELQVRVSNSDPALLSLHNISNGSGAGINFTDHASESQLGYIRYFHSDGASQGGGASFHITSTEQDLVLVLGTNTETARMVVKSANSNSEVDYGFYSDTNTGMYSPAADQVGLVAGGSRKLLINTTGAYIQNGNLYIPDHSLYIGNYIYHDGDTNTYIHFDSDKIRFDAGGQHLLQIREGFAGRHTGVHSPGSITAQNLAGANMIRKGTDIAVSTGNREEVSFFDGTKVQAHVSTGTGNTSSCYNWYSSENVPVDPEKDYEFSVWVKSTGDHNLYIGWHEYNSSGTQLSSNPYFRTSTTDTTSQSINNINGWTHFKFKLKSHRTTSGQADSAGTDRYADSDSQIIQNTGSNTDGVMHSACAFVHIRMGTCYGNTNTTKTYFYNPMITEAVYAEATQQLWTSIANIEKSATIGDAPVTPNSNFNELVISSPSHTGISIFSGGTTNHGAIYFGDNGANNAGQFKYLHDTNAFTFATNNNAASLTLDNNRNATFGSGLYIPSYIYHDGDTNSYFGFSANDTFQINTAGNERMRVTSTGKVGVGVDPSMMFHIKGGDENTLKLESTTGEPAIFWAPGGSSLKWEQRASASRWQLYQYDQSEWVFNIYNAKIGIGTVSPDAKLEVVGSNSNTIIVDGRASGSYNAANIYFKSGDSSGSWNAYRLKYVKDGSNDRLEFIDGSGNPNIYFNNGGAATFAGNTQAPKFIAAQSGYTDGYRLTRSGHDSYRICLGNSEGLRIVNETDSNREEFKFDGAGNATFTGNLAVTGDLNITGDINSVSVTDLDITDKTITIAKGAANSAAADEAGIVVDGAAASLLYDDTGTRWKSNKPFNVKVGSSMIELSEYNNGAIIWLDGSNGDLAGSDYYNIAAYGGGSGSKLSFGYAASEKMYMDMAGNLLTHGVIDVTGTGTSTIAGALSIKNGILNLDDNGDADGVINAKASLTINIDADNNSTGELFRVQSNTTSANNNPLFKIDEDGDVTIQGVGADTRLVIDDGATGQAITLQSSGSGEGFIKFTDANINRSGGDLNMWTNNLDIEFSTDNGSNNILQLTTADEAKFGTTQGSGSVSLYMTPAYQRMRLHYGDTGVDFLGYSGGTMWLITNSTTSNFTMGHSWDWDRQVTWRYVAGTSGAGGGIMKLGQFDKNHTNFTHGQTEFYTGNGTSTNLVMKLDTNKKTTLTGDLELSSDSTTINHGAGTTNSQPRLFIGEQSKYGVAWRWDSGSNIEFDGFWNSTISGSRNRDLGSINVNTLRWELNNDVFIGAKLGVNVSSINSGIALQVSGAAYFTGDIKASVIASNYISSSANVTLIPGSSGGVQAQTSYVELGNDIGNVSNDGSWNARLNVAGTSHARIDVRERGGDNIQSTWYAHNGHGEARFGTLSTHGLKFLVDNGSALSFTSSANATFAASVHLGSDSAQLQLGYDNDMQVYHNGANGEINIGTGSFTIDSAGDITLDAGGNDIRLFKAGVEYGKFKSDSNDLSLYSSVQDKDILLKGNDGGNTITALKLDMSEAGAATFNAGIQHTGLTMTTGTSVDQIKQFNFSTQLSANTWTDTGIDGSDLSTGTWVMQVLVSDYNLGGSHYTEYYSAILSWYASGTNETTHAVDEIPCHRAGHAPNDGDVQFRTTRQSSASLKLQVKHNEAYSAAPDQTGGKEFKFKFRRLM